MNKRELTGWKKIFSFTFIQYYRSKASVISLIVICLLIMLSGPVMSLIGSSGASKVLESIGECKIEEVYILNDTDIEFDASGFAEKNAEYSKINYIDTEESLDSLQEKFKTDSGRDLILHISLNDEKYNLTFYRSENSEISTVNTGVFSDAVEIYFKTCRMKHAGISQETEEMLSCDAESSVVDISSISEKKDDEFNPFEMTSVMIYAFVIMMIVLVSSQQIAASIVIEKSSKVIETLLLSARPLAIIVGKTLATMVVIICNFVMIIISGGISGILTSVLMSEKISESFSKAVENLNNVESNVEGINTPDLSGMENIAITPGRILFGIVAVLITTVLAYLFYSVISSVTGASCSSMEDLSSASSFISLATVLGVYMVMGSVMLNNDLFTNITYFFPFSGIYIVPIHYIFGKASLSDLLILWSEVIILTTVLFRFAAVIYQALIYHKGERLKIKNIIALVKAQKGSGKAS